MSTSYGVVVEQPIVTSYGVVVEKALDIVSYPSEVKGAPNEQKTINVTVKNNSTSPITCELRIKDHNNNIIYSEQVVIDANSQYTFTPTITLPSTTGQYTWTIEAYNVENATVDDSKTFNVIVKISTRLTLSVTPL